ncbi:PREDICTED: cleavage stimulation factor subunit 2 tau variant-like [Nicrophorus vespilloides]|uniref:Cleavage stimulation factor subunit 2 tau variant-like n=1 Tax=Nicrophorus vespilloides TaxID=110193 RepID=A0ABM1MNB2_NICVS|nr:PREDICTED: cleavage stimulation factor subunit 2 tau variant-like [Nicrophorus vespilloides]
MDSLDANIMDKSMRSVFVGNIPYEATEEKLKDIFGEVGQVLSFKLVFDRETGKPKGYGFCEYRDQETALSAMRNLNSYEIGGRNLRVDNACTEKSRMEMQNLMNQPPVENPYGEPIQAEKAPEAISKAVASLPPEQMFELMKQMKMCIQNNPSEARNMLLQNPQLSYALLQAQVVMRIIDPAVACNMLHPQTQAPPMLTVPEKNVTPVQINNFSSTPAPPQRQEFGHTTPQPNFQSQDIDLRSMDPRNSDPRMRPISTDQDMRSLPNPLPPPVAESFARDPRAPYQDTRNQPRGDPRQKNLPPANNPSPVMAPNRPVPVPAPQSIPRVNPGMSPNIGPSGASDQEKAALIMQVLQLSDEQIAMLPPEQRNSILVLKEQIAKSTQR